MLDQIGDGELTIRVAPSPPASETGCPWIHRPHWTGVTVLADREGEVCSVSHIGQTSNAGYCLRGSTELRVTDAMTHP